MKKIGFVDYYISEWHANNYPTWFKKSANAADFELAYAWAEIAVSPVDGVTTDEWCEKYGAEKCATLEELCEKSDFIVVLSPSNPEKHLKYAETVLRYGKPTYIDKTFAPDIETAEKIFAVGEKYGTPFFSTSALRYAEELDKVGNCTSIMTTGGGSTYEEYIIHQIEMVVKKLGVGAESVTKEQIGSITNFRVRYGDGRSALMVYGSELPFAAYMTAADGTSVYKSAKSDFFQHLAGDILRFFMTKEPSFPPEETLEAMRIRTMALS